MSKTFTKELKLTTSCNQCKSEIPRPSLICPECGAKTTYPEFLAAFIIACLGIMALYALYHY